MAKRRHTSKKSAAPLAIGLGQLATADRQSARAVRFLCKAILTPVEQPAFKKCKFVLDGEKYSAMLTAKHTRAILAVVSQNGNVPATVAALLGGLTKQVAEDIGALLNDLAESAEMQPGIVVPPPLGRCTYAGGQTPNLTNAQCMQYPDPSWNQNDPNCTGLGPPG